MSIFTIQGYKVHSQTGKLTAPDGQKYELESVGIPVHFYDAERCYINIGTINDPCSVNGYRLPVPENLELTGDYLSQFQKIKEELEEENTKWYSQQYEISKRVQVQRVPTMWDYDEETNVTLWFHPRWNREEKQDRVWSFDIYNENLGKGLDAPSDKFMEEEIADSLQSYQRLQWINDPEVIKASLVEAKKMFKSNIQPLIEEFIDKIETGEYAREKQDEAIKAKNEAGLVEETLKYAIDKFKDSPKVNVYTIRNPFKGITVVVVNFNEGKPHHFDHGDFVGIDRLASLKAGKPVKRIK